MKIYDVLREASDDSGDYQQMLAFTRANRVGGVPDSQQIPLALFKELKKQQQQNQALSRELSDAEKRIDQAMQSGELSKQELGMHGAELEREREAGEKQKTTVSQLGQQYAEREQASAEQMSQLTSQLTALKNKPGVDPRAAQELETQIKQLSKNSISAEKLASLEAHIASVQDMQKVDDTVIKDLVAQINSAQQATQELKKSRSSVTKDVSKTAQDALDQVAQMRQDIEVLRRVETDLEQELNDLRDNYKETDATLWDIESQTIPAITQDIAQLKTAKAVKDLPVPTAPQQRVQTPPAPQQPQWTPAARATAQRLINKGVLEPEPMSESRLHRAIAWATGKQP